MGRAPNLVPDDSHDFSRESRQGSNGCLAMGMLAGSRYLRVAWKSPVENHQFLCYNGPHRKIEELSRVSAKKNLYIFLAVWLGFSCIAVTIWMTDYDLLIGTTGTVFLIQGILNCIAVDCGQLLRSCTIEEPKKY